MKRISQSRGIFLSLLLHTIISGQAFGYSFTQDIIQGFYWSSFPISMTKWASDTTDGPLLASLTDQAVQAWEDSMGVNAWKMNEGYEVGNPTVGNFIKWSFNFASETGWNPETTLAVTIRYNTGTFITRTVIILNGNNEWLRSNWNNSLYKTILHELGHTIGLDHSEETAIMQASIGTVGSLQSDDIAGGNAVMDEQNYRNSIGYVSPFSGGQGEESNPLGCGSIENVSGGPGGGSLNFVFSLLMGVLLGFMSKLKSHKREFLSVQF